MDSKGDKGLISPFLLFFSFAKNTRCIMRNKGVDFDYREESIPINKVTNRSSYTRFIVVGFSCESMTERKDGLRALRCFSFIFQINTKGVETMNIQQFDEY